MTTAVRLARPAAARGRAIARWVSIGFLARVTTTTTTTLTRKGGVYPTVPATQSRASSRDGRGRHRPDAMV
jgi:hypothetical protein